jgi:hypothetical protein
MNACIAVLNAAIDRKIASGREVLNSPDREAR